MVDDYSSYTYKHRVVYNHALGQWEFVSKNGDFVIYRRDDHAQVMEFAHDYCNIPSGDFNYKWGQAATGYTKRAPDPDEYGTW